MSSEKFDLDAALADENVPAGLRDYAKQVAADNKKLKAEADVRAKADRSNTLGSALKDAGASEKLARFYPADQDVTGEAIVSWLKENADVFGVKLADTANTTTTTATDHSPAVTDILAMQKVQEATPTEGGTPTLLDQAKAIDGLKMKTAEDRAALDAFNRTLMGMAAQDQNNHFAQMAR